MGHAILFNIFQEEEARKYVQYSFHVIDGGMDIKVTLD